METRNVAAWTVPLVIGLALGIRMFFVEAPPNDVEFKLEIANSKPIKGLSKSEVRRTCN